MLPLTLLVSVVLLLSAPLAAQTPSRSQMPPQGGAIEQIVAKVVSREKDEMAMIRQHAPLVETYIQKVRITENDASWVPDGDHYFIGRAEFAKGMEVRSLPHP